MLEKKEVNVRDVYNFVVRIPVEDDGVIHTIFASIFNFGDVVVEGDGKDNPLWAHFVGKIMQKEKMHR